MTSNIGAISLVVLSLVTSAPGPGASQVFVPAQDLVALHHWKLNIDTFLVIRGQAAQVAPPAQLPTSAAELFRAQNAFAAEIRARRQNARAGDLFTPDVQRTFRKLIAKTLSDHEIAGAALVVEFLADILPGGTWPAVNEPFSWQLGTAMPGCLLNVLPQLPTGLQYRLVAYDLILLDIDANLVIDILPEALPSPVSLMTSRGSIASFALATHPLSAPVQPPLTRKDHGALQFWMLVLEEHLVIREEQPRRNRWQPGCS